MKKDELELESDSPEFTGASSTNDCDSYMGTKGPKLEGAASSRHQRHSLREGIKKIKEHLYLFYEPEPETTAKLDIYFFHGLDCEFEAGDTEDADLLTWRSTGQPEEIWPGKWLPEDFPEARIISICCDCSSEKLKTSGILGFNVIAEHIWYQITNVRREHGQIPMILVGHGFGGALMKQLCIEARKHLSEGDRFLESVRGFYFYDNLEGAEALMMTGARPLLTVLQYLDKRSGLLHLEFHHLHRQYRWKIFGLGGIDAGALPTWSTRLQVLEASSRLEDIYIRVNANHSFTCRPADRYDRRYTHLRQLVDRVLSQVKPVQGIPGRRMGINECMSLFYEPEPANTANLDVLFFHGLDFEFQGADAEDGDGRHEIDFECQGPDLQDANILTWRSRGEPQEVWPQKWLPEDFAKARIISICYNCNSQKRDESERRDLDLITEYILDHITRFQREHGYTPVIFVGHGFGGIVMKSLCVYAHRRDGNNMFDRFLKTIRGLYFYDTPHLGMEGIEAPVKDEGELLEWMRPGCDMKPFGESERLHAEFQHLHHKYRWIISGIGGGRWTWSQTSVLSAFRVSLTSSRYGKYYITADESHNLICRPRDRSDRMYVHLKEHIGKVLRKAEVENIRRQVEKINECMSLFYEPEPANTSNLDVLFFHGLDFEFLDDEVHYADTLTWRSRGELEEVWPQKWLPEEFAKARIISICYNCKVRKRDESERTNLYLIAEYILARITRFQRERGYTPVIFVGHGFGGIVMKSLCVYAHSRDGDNMYYRFLKTIRGFYFYDTPHLGMHGIETPLPDEGELLGRMRPWDRESERLHADFQHLHRKYRWIISGLGAGRVTESEEWPRTIRVSLESSRYGEDYITFDESHLFACRPRDRSDRSYVHLKELIERVLRQVEEENIRREGEKLNDYVYELYKPIDGPAEMDILFFHGLNLNSTASNDIHVSAWTSGEGSEAHLWPKTWLSQDFPRARILAISYDSHLITTAEQGRTDLHNTAESLMTCLLLEREPLLLRPLILVGHCFGGVLIKQLCVHAHDRQGEGAQMETRTELRCFLKNIKAILFLGTPHHGMTLPGPQKPALGKSSPLMKNVQVLNEDAARLHGRFDNLTREYKWRIASVGELNETKLGASRCVMVPEASARYGEFTSVQADHIALSKPTGKDSLVYMLLTKLIEEPSSRDYTPGNEQTVPPIASELLAFQVEKAHRILKNSTCLGFHGMGGIGKSTLARVVFNRLNAEFEYSCFISDVKLKTRITHEDLLHAMHQYGEKMKYNECTWGHLRGRKVLVVLDDVDKYEHLQILGYIASNMSSREDRYIVTSRDVALLGTLRSILQPREVELYSVPFLDESSARKLLLSHGVPDPPAEEFVDGVVEVCNGLPLSLEVIGKYLHENKGEKEIWKKSVEALRNCADIYNFKERLWDILQLSYDSLANEAKEMFLDSSSFFVGSSWRLQEAKVAWRVHFDFADDFWKSLVKKSLVYDVRDDELILMHEQMKDLGTKLAMGSGDGGKCSRTWNKRILSKALGIPTTEPRQVASSSAGRTSRKQVISVSRHLRERIKDVIALRLEEPMPITMVDISNMRALRYLDSSKYLTPIRGEKIPSGVVLLRWRGQITSIADMFDPDQMYVLTVFHLEAPRLHEVPDSFGFLPRLQILTFTGCKFTTLPHSFGELRGLQHLEFSDCTELCSLPESFGRLSNLEFLSFSVADMYGEKSSEAGDENFLPASFGDLVHLKILILYGCRSLHALPESFSKLESLEELRIERCNNLLKLSELFGELPELRTLDVCQCRSLPEVPVSFGTLSKLRAVCIADCESFRAFPETLGDLVSLESLVISDCKSLHQLPGTLGQLSKLRKLEICGTEADELRTTVSSLGSQLQHLSITEREGQISQPSEIPRCNNEPGLPDSLEHLSRLEHLEPIDWERIRALPDNFGNLTSLETLAISLCSITALPDSFSNLRNLTELSLVKCPLTDLPKEFGNLARLETLILRDSNVSLLPDSLSNLANLKELEMSNCLNLTILPKSLGNITSLTKLTMSNCGIIALPESLCELFKLDELVILSCPLNYLPSDFQKLGALRLLTLIELPWTSVPTCIKCLPSLHTLTVKLPKLTDECEWLGEGLSTLRSYSRFCIRNEEFHLVQEESWSDDER